MMSSKATSEAPDQHSDKYNDPRVRVTRRGIWLGIGIVLFGVIGSATSIYMRRTHLGETTRFWGQETITALQLGERIYLLPRGADEFNPVELTATPGLGLLRRALLDERNFNWTTETDRSAIEHCSSKPGDVANCVQLRITDPSAHRVGTIEIDLDLAGGWVGPSEGSRRVQTTDRMRPKLKNYFATIINVRQKRYDHRD